MPLTAKEIADLKRLIKERVDNYPDLEAMVANGQLTYKAGWYEPKNKEAFDAIAPYATSFRVGKDGKGAVKVSKQSKRLKTLADKL